MANDLVQMYGPGYAGYLNARNRATQEQMQGLQGLGMLSNMQTAQLQRDALQAQLAERQRAMQQAQERDTQVRGYLSGQTVTPEQAGSLPGGPTNENAGMIGAQTQPPALGGMPIDQVRALYMFGGADAVAKAMQENLKTPEKARLISMLPQSAQPAALLHAAGVGPQVSSFDAGGTMGMQSYDPVTQSVSVVSQRPKTAAPASRPVWLNNDGSVDESLYQRQIGLNRAGAAAAPSLTINSPLLPGKDAANKVDQNILDAGQQMSGLTAIEQQYRPEYQTLGARWSALQTGMKERLGLGVSREDKQALQDFTKYRAVAANQLNSYIKAMTGAALSEAEAERLTKAVPNAGQGMFDGDSPTEFKAKLDAVTADLRKAIARNVFIKRRGFAIGDVPLEQMPSIINNRGAEIKEEIKQSSPNTSDADIAKMARRRLAEEFGLIYEQ